MFRGLQLQLDRGGLPLYVALIREKWVRYFSVEREGERKLCRHNANKTSEGGRRRGSPGMFVWKSCQKRSARRSRPTDDDEAEFGAAVRSIVWLADKLFTWSLEPFQA